MMAVVVKNGVNVEPKAFTCSATPASRAASAKPAASFIVRAAMWRYIFGDSCSSDHKPAVMARGFPESVPAW